MLKRISLIVLAILFLIPNVFNAMSIRVAIAEDLKVNADEVLNAKDLIVQFVLPTVSGDKVLLKIDYGSKGKIQDAHFFLPQLKEDGTYSYELITQQNRKLRLIFYFENGEYSWAKIDSDFSPQEDAATGDTVLTVVSLGGYKINFRFSRRDSQVVNVRVYPEINPYYPGYKEFDA